MYRFAGGSVTFPHSPIECLEGRHGEGSDAKQQRKEKAKAGQEQEERRRSDLTVQTRLLVRQPIRQEALVSSPLIAAVFNVSPMAIHRLKVNGENDGGAIED
jgi:hypothetical protein